ncbi:MAG: dTMP kinase [Gemmatimonadaceae bacterium]|nr:dTMP kinase [Gemmatimonadaceae bacterium]
MTGRLLVFEGVEGAGKSTQVAALAARIAGAGLACRTWREPGGTPAGDAIRAMLLDPAVAMDARTEALLFMASRAELLAREVRPALAVGDVVILDRFFLSTYAYQAAGRGLPQDEVAAANRVATGGLVPDLTLLVAVPSPVGLARVRARGASDRIERSGDDFHERVEAAFATFASATWQRAHPEAGPIEVVDGGGAAHDVESRVNAAVARRLPDLAAWLGEVA